MDTEVMSKHCKLGQIWSKREGTDEYHQWKNSYNCKISHSKSSGAMESDGAIAVFKRSVDNYILRYTHYIGHGDTRS